MREITRHDDGSSSWQCEKCKNTVWRERSQSEASCAECGAQYNCVGQRLRDDWRGNRSSWDEDVSDLDGFEEQALRRDQEIDSYFY